MALGQIFVINYVASHVTLSIVVTVPLMIGLAVGLALSRGAAMLLLAPLALSMVFMITAWTYCLRGWIASMMTNPRRRRTVIMSVGLAFFVIAQLPNLYLNVINPVGRNRLPPGANAEDVRKQREAQQSAQAKLFGRLLAAEKFIPPLWVPVGAQSLAEQRPLPALLGTLGCLAIGSLGLRRAYRSTLRFYVGKTGGLAAQLRPQRETARSHARQVRRELDGTSIAGDARNRRRLLRWPRFVPCCERPRLRWPGARPSS